MTRLVLKDDLLDAHVLRALATAASGGADVGEVPVTAHRCSDGSLDSWYAAWASPAARFRAQADSDAAAGQRASALSGCLRATTYDRTAGVVLMGVPTDPRMRDAYRRQSESFQAAIP